MDGGFPGHPLAAIRIPLGVRFLLIVSDVLFIFTEVQYLIACCPPLDRSSYERFPLPSLFSFRPLLIPLPPS